MDSQNLGGLIIFQNVRWSGPFLRLLRNGLIILQYTVKVTLPIRNDLRE